MTYFRYFSVFDVIYGEFWQNEYLIVFRIFNEYLIFFKIVETIIIVDIIIKFILL